MVRPSLVTLLVLACVLVGCTPKARSAVDVAVCKTERDTRYQDAIHKCVVRCANTPAAEQCWTVCEEQANQEHLETGYAECNR